MPGPVQPDPKPTPPRAALGAVALLDDVWRNSIEVSYLTAHSNKTKPLTPKARLRRAPVTAILAVLAGVLVVVTVSGLRTPEGSTTHETLVRQVTERRQQVEQRAFEVRNLQAEVDELGALTLERKGDERGRFMRPLARAAGAAAVHGPGIQLRLDDSQKSNDVQGGPRAPSSQDGNRRGRVQDRDLQVAVNGLWESGAEAIAINGERVTSLTSIRDAGAAVLVNYRPLSPPYELVAIGEAKPLASAFQRSFAGRYVAGLEQNYGVKVDLTVQEDVEIPAHDITPLRIARPADPWWQAREGLSPTPTTSQIPAVQGSPPVTGVGPSATSPAAPAPMSKASKDPTGPHRDRTP